MWSKRGTCSSPPPALPVSKRSLRPVEGEEVGEHGHEQVVRRHQGAFRFQKTEGRGRVEHRIVLRASHLLEHRCAAGNSRAAEREQGGGRWCSWSGWRGPDPAPATVLRTTEASGVFFDDRVEGVFSGLLRPGPRGTCWRDPASRDRSPGRGGPSPPGGTRAVETDVFSCPALRKFKKSCRRRARCGRGTRFSELRAARDPRRVETF